MINITKIEKVLVPSFTIHNGIGETLTEKMNEKETEELRNKASENILKKYYAEEQRIAKRLCKELNVNYEY